MRQLNGIAGFLAVAFFAGDVEAAVPSESDVGRNFFERKIRPLLIAKCLKCHSGSSPKSGLTLENRKGWVKGGTRGRAIRPGQPDRSLLIQVVRGDHADLQMPPEGESLSTEEIATLVEWVKLGAYDPRKPTQRFRPSLVSAEKVAQHWAFKPVRRPRVPAVEGADTPVDAFIRRGQARVGLAPSPQADERTLVRRLYFDLIGLPPAISVIERLKRRGAGEEWRQLVDQLLADPRHGERWGRHWLDVARYADSAGYRAVGKQRRFPFSYTYRDYVIRSFNEGKSFDDFARDQLAADFLLDDSNRRNLAGLGFLTVGKTFLDDQNLVIEDRIDVVTRGFMGLTVQCARCHDHKYDPIPTADYYSLYGVFDSSRVPKELPLLGEESASNLHADYVAEREKRETAYTERFAAEVELAQHRIREVTGNYLLAVHEFDPPLKGAAKQRFMRERKLVPVVFDQWRRFLSKENEAHPILSPWLEFTTRNKSEWGKLNRQFRSREGAASKLNREVARIFEAGDVVSVRDLANRYNDLCQRCDTFDPQANADREAIRRFLRASDSPTTVPESQHLNLVHLVREPLNALRARIEELDGEHPGAPARAMVLEDRPKPREPVVFVRGNPDQRGEVVPRQFLSLASSGRRKPFTLGSGRLELANSIVDRRNPLTARVFVNRVWMHHFGAPLVATPSDFGVRAAEPTHPDLLDWLASEFVDSGWSVKHLHRLIVNSSTYRQSSSDRPAARAIDPENKLLWRMNFRRLELEPMRDNLLAVTGQLDARQGGLARPLLTNEFNHRRTIYGFIERNNLPGLLRNFDLASPDVSAAKRIETTVPQQALFLMNSPFVKGLASKLVSGSAFERVTETEDRIRLLWHRFFQRDPTALEVEDGVDYLRTAKSRAGYWGPIGWQYGTGDLDSHSGRVKGFEPFAHFTGERWQAGEHYPDARLGHARMKDAGGHTSSQEDRDVIRRWTAPADGIVSVRGQVAHRETEGNGVTASVVSSRQGILGQWHVKKGVAPTVFDAVPVRLGDSIDFVCDNAGNEDHDTFIWIPVVEYSEVRALPGRGEVLRQWRAKADFFKRFAPLPPPPTHWEQYVQALLQANELHYVD